MQPGCRPRQKAAEQFRQRHDDQGAEYRSAGGAETAQRTDQGELERNIGSDDTSRIEIKEILGKQCPADCRQRSGNCHSSYAHQQRVDADRRGAVLVITGRKQVIAIAGALEPHR